MECVDSSLILCGKNACREVGNVGSYVGSNAIKLEVEVLALLGEILRTKSYTLDYNRESNEVVVVGVLLPDVGDVNEVEGLDSSVNNLNRCVLELGKCVVGLSLTGDTNGHTNLDTEISNGIRIIHLIVVVTANAGGIHYEEVVSGVTKRLGVNENNDTLNGKEVAGLSICVILPSVNLELSKLAAEVSDCYVTLFRGDGSGKSVGSLLGSILGNLGNLNNNGSTIGRNGDGNLVGRSGPNYGEGSVADSNLTYESKVCGGVCGIILVELTHVCRCIKKCLILGIKGAARAAAVFAVSVLMGLFDLCFTVITNVVAVCINVLGAFLAADKTAETGNLLNHVAACKSSNSESENEK